MNKKQRRVLFIAIILFIIVLMCKPTINWKAPKTEQDKIRIQQVRTQIDRIFIFYIPFSILIISGLMIYTLRDKNKK
jgi:hypothetical protein